MSSPSELRLFLSIDLTGSTELKNNYNQNILFAEFSKQETLLKGFVSESELSWSDEQIKKFIANGIDIRNFDWAEIIKEAFQDFHVSFLKNLKEKKDVFFPWKAVGDELIYSFLIKDELKLHDYVLAFLQALRELDKKYSTGGQIRIKGTAWVAGFPVRNRIIELPFPDLFYKDKDGEDCEFLFPKTDFLGPDMDIGFRLQNCTWPGFLTCSMDLVELLGSCSTSNQMRFIKVGWSNLKGVWNVKPYPVFWGCLPKNAERSVDKYDEYKDGDQLICPFLNSYIENKGKEHGIKEAKEFLDEIKKIRDGLSENLGMIKPYIVSSENTDVNNIPSMHVRILEVLDMLVDDKGNSLEESNSTTVYTDSEKELISKALKKNRNKRL